MDAYLVKHGPGKYEAGHVEETPKGWEVRYERVDGKTKQGKVCNIQRICFDPILLMMMYPLGYILSFCFSSWEKHFSTGMLIIRVMTSTSMATGEGMTTISRRDMKSMGRLGILKLK